MNMNTNTVNDLISKLKKFTYKLKNIESKLLNNDTQLGGGGVNYKDKVKLLTKKKKKYLKIIDNYQKQLGNIIIQNNLL